VHFTDEGMEAFNPEGERKHVKYVLLRNKGIYLERMGRIVQALRIVDKVWPELKSIDQTETVLSFYWLRSDLLRPSGVLDEALKLPAGTGCGSACLTFGPFWARSTWISRTGRMPRRALMWCCH